MKDSIRKFFRGIGLEVKKYTPFGSDHALMKKIIRDFSFDLIIDVGAHVGTFGNEVREIGYRGQIISFEPILQSYQKLAITAQKDGNWQAIHSAIGNQEGEVRLNIAGNSFSSSILDMQPTHLKAEAASKYVEQQQVKITRLDTFMSSAILQNYQAIMLKVDVQGFEMEVLNGALSILPHVKLVQLELSFVSLYEKSPLYTDIIARMSSLGFSLFTLMPEFRDPFSGRLLQADGIFVNETKYKF